MELLKDLVKQKFGRQKIYQQAQESLVISEANKLLAEVLPQAKAGLEAIYLKNKILTVAVLNDDLLPGLKAKKAKFIDKLNGKFTDQVVVDWNFLV